MKEAPPSHPETTIVYATNYDVMDRVYQWLVSGEHQFRSVGHDHLTEIQERVIFKFNGTNALREADWGTLLRHMKDYVRKHRDLVFLPNTIECVMFACATEQRDGRIIPQLSGKMRDALPYLVDLIGYMYIDQPEDAPPQRKVLVEPYPPFEAKDRTHVLSAQYGPTITIKDQDQPALGGSEGVSEWLSLISQHQGGNTSGE